MNDTSEIPDLRDVCERLLSLLIGPLNSLEELKWNGKTTDQTFEFIKRASIIRQRECCDAILKLVDLGMSSAGVSMLRPAYEELVWIEYLNKNPDHSLDLIRLLSQRELVESHAAQRDYLGQKGLRSIGFTKQLSRRIERMDEPASQKLKDLGKKLQWRNGATRPTVAQISRKVGREKQYKYLYHGTSKYVHFSPHELQRRVWGKHGEVTISSKNYERYWRDFAMSWSFRILIETLIASGYSGRIIEQEGWDDDQFTDLLSDLRPIQILTATELESWEEPKNFEIAEAWHQ